MRAYMYACKHTNYIHMQISSAGRVMYAGDKSGNVWAVEARDQNWESVACFSGQTKRVTAVHYCKRNGTIIAANLDSTIRVSLWLGCYACLC